MGGSGPLQTLVQRTRPRSPGARNKQQMDPSIPQSASRSGSSGVQAGHARGSRGRFVPASPGVGGVAAGQSSRGSRGTIEARKAEYASFLRIFLLPSECRDDWVPYAQGPTSPLTKLYEAAVEPKFRVGGGSRAGLSRKFFYGTDAGAAKTGLPRRNVVDPVNGTRARTRLFTERRLPRAGAPAEILAIRAWLEGLAQKSMLRSCWNSIPECLAALTVVLGTYRQGVHGWGYVGYPAVTDARNGGRVKRKAPDAGEEEDDELAADGLVDIPGGIPGGGIGEVAGSIGVHGAGGDSKGLTSVVKEVVNSWVALLTTAGGGGGDVRIDDAVRELRLVLGRVGAVGDVGDDDSLAEALEAACGKDAFRVNGVAFKVAFDSVVANRKLVIPMELPKEFGECFLAAAAPATELGSRQAARVLVKVWNDTKATPVAVQLFQQRHAIAGKPLMDREFDVAAVRTVLQGFCPDNSDELAVSTFEKAARQILFDEK